MLNVVVDISHHNSVTDFAAVRKNGVLGVIHKATQGLAFVDPQYHVRRSLAIKAGLLWGAYHFGTNADAIKQAEHFLTTVNPEPTDLLILDFEQDPAGSTMMLSGAEQFVTAINEHTGRFPGLYSGQNFIQANVGTNQTTLSNCFLWIARYSDQLPSIPPAWSRLTFWQYTDGIHGPEPHEVPGIGPCDRSKFNGTLGNLQHLWGVKK